jgi:hypothetical protein
MGRRAWLVAASLVVAIGCGLDLAGSGDPEGDADAGDDAGAATDAPPAACGSGECFELAPGWTLVALAQAPQACPSSYGGTTTDLFVDASPRSGACACGCRVTTPPSCVHGAIGAHYDNTGSLTCGTASTYAWANASDGVCDSDEWPGPYDSLHDWRFTPPAPSGGSCITTADTRKDLVDRTGAAQACAAGPPGCACAPVPPDPIEQCILADGDVPCPNGPFARRRTMGKDFQVTCDAGPCACAVAGGCAGGAMTFFAQTGCTGASFSLPADGGCGSVPDGGMVGSYRYTANVVDPSCQADGSTTDVALTMTATVTLCCR